MLPAPRSAGDVNNLALSFPSAASSPLSAKSFGIEPFAFHLLYVCPRGLMSLKPDRRKHRKKSKSKEKKIETKDPFCCIQSGMAIEARV